MKYLLLALGLGAIIFAYHHFMRIDEPKVPQPKTKLTGEAMEIESATFAGGCFWCMVHPFDSLQGVHSVVSGYMGGTGSNPTYEDYAQKGHVEVVQITYNPKEVSYEELLSVLWHNMNPTDPDGQFGDRGPQYRSAIFYHTDAQKIEAEKSKKALQDSGQFSKPIVTEILPTKTFYPAEDYHQDYYKKNPVRYNFFRLLSGRDSFLKKAWQTDKTRGERSMPFTNNLSTFVKPSDAELKKKLTPLQYKVTQKDGTERAYENEYWDNKRPGIYVDIVSGEPLFSSLDKFDSGTGWPSFSKTLEKENVLEKEDKGWFLTRTEVRSKHGDSHLGHVFNDGPAPTGLRYCMNSAALRFIPADDLEKEGYGKFKHLFAAA